MFIIAGLGNPKKEYFNTRHNIGFSMIDALADAFNISVSRKNFNALTGNGHVDGTSVLLMKPLTYMNLSGESIGAALSFYKSNPQNEILVIYDDVDLDVGSIRIRKSGSAGGHNGLKNIIAHLGTQEFIRLRVGIGEKPPRWELADYVLGRFTKEETDIYEKLTPDIIEAVKLIAAGSTDKAMNVYN